MTVTTAMVKELREATGAGFLECKKTLEATGGDFQRAGEALREKGLAVATKKMGRETNAGLVVVHESPAGVCAVELDCETDFAAGTDEFKRLAHRIADQLLADARLTNAEQILATDFIDTPGKLTSTVIQELVGKLGENITLSHVARYGFADGLFVKGYIHSGDVNVSYAPTEGRMCALLELAVDSGATVDAAGLKDLARDLALHITSARPRYLAPDDVPADDKESAQELCLLMQPFIRNDSLTVEQILQQKGSAVGGAVTVRRFARFEVSN